MSRLVLAIMLALSVTLPLYGCGKKGDVRLPEGVSDDFPKKYPRN